MKRALQIIVLAALLSLAALPVMAVTSQAAAATPYCGITWGSLPKSADSVSPIGSITNVRTGQHECFDRTVVDLNAPGAGYLVKYVNSYYAEGSGILIPLQGGAKLQILIQAPTYDENYNVTYPATVGQTLPNINLTGYSTFRDLKYGGSFEGQTSFGLGVRALLPFRVFKLSNPDRIVIDVAHKWSA